MTTPDGARAYGLVMPFVSVQSKGGPYDDDSYAAGWELGRLDRELEHADETYAGGRYLIHDGNVGQADLVAMRHGFVSRPVGEHHGWTELLLTRADALA